MDDFKGELAKLGTDHEEILRQAALVVCTAEARGKKKDWRPLQKRMSMATRSVLGLLLSRVLSEGECWTLDSAEIGAHCQPLHLVASEGSQGGGASRFSDEVLGQFAPVLQRWVRGDASNVMWPGDPSYPLYAVLEATSAADAGGSSSERGYEDSMEVRSGAACGVRAVGCAHLPRASLRDRP